MPRLSLWRNQRDKNYKFIDFHIKQLYEISGTAVYIHKYLGPVEQGNEESEVREKNDSSQPNYENTQKGESDENDIQDLLYIENRDRKYSKDVIELKGQYEINDTEFDLRQFGLFLSGDNIVITFPFNDMTEKVGRALMSGDVIELPHLRMSPMEGEPQNRYYVVEDAARAAEGYDAHWWHHIWRCRCSPMQNQQEYMDILQQEAENPYGEEYGKSIEEIVSNLEKDFEVNDAVEEEGERQVPNRYWDKSFMYIWPHRDENGNIMPSSLSKRSFRGDHSLVLHYSDAKPPDGTVPVGQGTEFPKDAKDGDYFLRTDYRPNVLFMRYQGRWVREEVDWRHNWTKANRTLVEFINQQGTYETSDGREINRKQAVSKILKPKTDYE